MSDTRKDMIKSSYDAMASSYNTWATSQSSPRTTYTTQILSSITSPSSLILELGCGAGLPISRQILDSSARLIANDISTTQISLARRSCPDITATFIPGDMLTLSFQPETFDGVVAFFSIFHLPREEQKVMFQKVFTGMKTGSKFAFNLGSEAKEEIRDLFFGKEMFWSGWGVERSLEILREVGFVVESWEVRDAGDGEEVLGEEDPDYGVRFLWVVCRKP
jgi:cyclopropane fatty-acyl-phospholipid synthase-like methyltransferase